MASKCDGWTAKIKISEFLTASILSLVKVTFLYPSNSEMEFKCRFVKYNVVMALVVINPFAIDFPKFPVPIMAIFMVLISCCHDPDSYRDTNVF
jgi:hypothetical protein